MKKRELKVLCKIGLMQMVRVLKRMARTVVVVRLILRKMARILVVVRLRMS